MQHFLPKMLHLVFERALQLNFDGFPKLDITQFSASIEQQGFKWLDENL